MMKIRTGVTQVIAGVMVLMITLDICAQTPADQPQEAPGGARFTVEQLDQMLAPIALYPDPLLAQILMAATYPLEIVQADRWLQDPDNAALKGDQLTAALEQQPWEPSVKSLVPFPQILRMLDDNLNWTEQLGDAFLSERPAVMDSVQRLRQAAQAAGRLQSTPQQVVSAQGQAIMIEPSDPEIVYVPVYDPYVVYGVWPYPDFPPYYFEGFFDGVVFGGLGIGWFGFGIDAPLWGWGRWDWDRHRVDIDRGRFNRIHARHPPINSGTWHHDPSHRHGVPYGDEKTRTRFHGENGDPDARRRFRGYPPAQTLQPTPGIVQPLPGVVQPLPQVVKPLPPVVQPLPAVRQPKPTFEREPGAAPLPSRPAPLYRAPSPPAFESFGRREDIRVQSERGHASRRSEPAMTGHGSEGRQQPMPQPRRQSAPSPGGKERR